MTLDDDAALLEAQGDGCAICGRPEPDGASLHVDHDHTTGLVRGLLCFRCNGGLGQLDEDVDRLVAAIAYLDAGGFPEMELVLARERAAALVGTGGARTGK